MRARAGAQAEFAAGAGAPNLDAKPALCPAKVVVQRKAPVRPLTKLTQPEARSGFATSCCRPRTQLRKRKGQSHEVLHADSAKGWQACSARRPIRDAGHPADALGVIRERLTHFLPNARRFDFFSISLDGFAEELRVTSRSAFQSSIAAHSPPACTLSHEWALVASRRREIARHGGTPGHEISRAMPKLP